MPGPHGEKIPQRGWSRRGRSGCNRPTLIESIFSSVAHVWVPGGKTTGPIVNKFGVS
jgi:hypothetical protein